jgi:hypothetical protein
LIDAGVKYALGLGENPPTAEAITAQVIEFFATGRADFIILNGKRPDWSRTLLHGVAFRACERGL